MQGIRVRGRIRRRGKGCSRSLLRALLTPGDPLGPSLLGHSLPISRGGTAQAALALSRVLGATLVAAWLTATTPFARLVAALAWARVPAPLLEILLLAHRSRFALAEALHTVRCAQSMRLGYVGARRSLASAGALVGAAACRAIDRAAATAALLVEHLGLGKHLVPDSMTDCQVAQMGLLLFGRGLGVFHILQLPGLLPANASGYVVLLLLLGPLIWAHRRRFAPHSE